VPAKLRAFLVLLAFAGCAAPTGGTTQSALLPVTDDVPNASIPLGKYIQHVVIIVQENRSFENMFAGWPGADAPLFALSAAQPGVKIPMKPIPFSNKDIDHLYLNALAGYDNGKMDGFSNNQIGTTGEPVGTWPYSYLEHDVIKPYRTMATQYVLADHMFPAMFGPSFTAHLDLVSGTTSLSTREAVVDLPNATPWGCDSPAGTATPLLLSNKTVERGVGPHPCYTQFRTMADTLDAKGVSWKYYAPNILDSPAWSAFDAIKNVRYGPDWAKVTSPQTKALTDPAAGALPQVSWVTPDYLDSDHPETNSDTGPSWVADVVNAIGKSKYWNTTAIIVVWDDWGGWYDNVKPPQLDYKGLGIRVPCIIISPYAKKGYVSHTQYEFGSLLKFAEQAFGLKPLGTAAQGYTDGRAASIVDSFDFTQAPRAFTTISAKYPPSYFLNRKQSLKLPDDE
jgi:phospholipase C